MVPPSEKILSALDLRVVYLSKWRFARRRCGNVRFWH